MGKNRRRHPSQPAGFWRQQVGGAPYWFLAVAAVGLIAFGAFVAVNAPSASADRGTPREEATSTPTPETTEAAEAETPVAPITASNGRPAPVALILGDSYSQGGGASNPDNGWAAIVTRELGWESTVLSAPGGGYALPGTNGQSILQMLEATDLATLKPDVVVIQSGYNDTSAEDTATRAAINAARTILSEQLPSTPVVVVGQFWPGEPTPSSKARAATIQNAWATSRNALVLDPIAGGWSSFNTTDDRHPDDAGHALIAQNIIDAMRADGLLG